MIPAAGRIPSPPRPTCLDRLHPAIRLGGALLGAVGALAVDPVSLLAMLVVVVVLLARTGLGPGAQLAALRPWLPAAVLVVLVHAFTSTEFAPLWRFSAGGTLAGGLALLRVGVTLGWLALYVRTSGLEDSITAAGWWLAPLRRLGAPTHQLGLVLAVALGTIPGVMAEGRRTEAVVRMRRAAARRGRGSFATRMGDRVRVVVPLVETLVRRAENLTLALRSRAPAEPATVAGPPAAQVAVLLIALGLLVWWAAAAPLAPGDWGAR